MSRQQERLVVVGNGMAAMRTVETLLSHAPRRYDVTVIGADPHPSYNRILLSAVLAGERTFDDAVTHGPGWYADNGVRLLAGHPVTAIDRKAMTVAITGTATVIAYDKLLLATGSKPLAPPIPGLDLPGVRAFRDIADAAAMIAAAKRHRSAIVIGGGLLGLEAAWGLRRRGMQVAVVHLTPTLMERQLDMTAGEMLRRDLEARGIVFFTSCQAEEITGSERVEGVRLADGRHIAADLVVVAIGIRPNVYLAAAAGLDVNRGILVGDDMRTTDPKIYAVGECVEHNGRVVGLIAPIWEQAAVCGARLAGDETAVYLPSPVFTSLKITGVNVFSAGSLAAEDEADEELALHDPRRGVYKKLVLRAGRIVGCVLYGDVADGSWYLDLMRDGADISALRDRIVFGRDFAQAA